MAAGDAGGLHALDYPLAERGVSKDSGKRVRMTGILFWILFGLVVGLIAKFIVPGEAPGGILGDIIVGIVGAFIGGWIFSFFGHGGVTGWNAVVLLWVLRAISGRRTA